MDALMGIFREKKVHSSQIGILSILMYPFLLSFLCAPIVDKYFSESFGKRKSYLVPCKLIIFLGLFIFSFYADDLVQRQEIKTIAIVLFLIGLVQLFDYNALTGLRFELYGLENTAMASFTLYAGTHSSSNPGIMLGTFFGYHLFVLLNSDYVCRDVLGVSSSALVSHRTANLFFAFCNLFSGIGVYFINERDYTACDPVGVINTFKLIKVFLTDRVYRRATLWIMLSCCGAMSLRATVTLQLIKRGMKREHIVMMLACNATCNIVNNFVLKRFMVPGQIIRMCTLFLCLYLTIIYVDYYNVMTFSPTEGYTKGLFLYAIGIFFEGACPWMSYQIGFINSTTYYKYAATYQTTLMGIVNVGKIFPVSLTITMLDYIPYPVLFFMFNLGNIAFLLLSYKPWACKIDDTPIEEYHESIKKIEPQLLEQNN